MGDSSESHLSQQLPQIPQEQKKCQMGTVKTDFRKTIQSVSLSRNQLSDLFNISDLYKINKK